MLKELDPRSKVVLSGVLATLAVFFNHPFYLLPLLLFTLVLLPFFDCRPLQLILRMRRLIMILLGLMIIQSVFYPGDTPLIEIGTWTLATLEGLLQGLSLVLRLFIILGCGLILSSSPPARFVQGLVAWALPYELAYMVSLGIRFLPLLREEAGDVFTALQLRGVDLKRMPWVKQLRIYRSLFFPLVTMAILRSKQIALSMEARAFRAFPRRTFLHSLQLKTPDYATMIISLSAGVSLIFLYFRGLI